MNKQRFNDAAALAGVSVVTAAGVAFRAEAVFAIGLVGFCLWVAIMTEKLNAE